MDESPRREPAPDRDPVMQFLDTWVWPYVDEGALWPVLFALEAHLVLLIALAFLQAYRASTPLAWAAVILLGLLSFDLCRREFGEKRRPGRLFVIVVINWVLGAITAAFTGSWGVF